MTTASSPQRRPGDGSALRHEPRDALPAGTVVGDGYRIERTLGQGGFGIVYLATDLDLQRPLAIKEYLPVQLAGRGEGAHIGLREAMHRDTFVRGLQSFLREARLLAQFDHPSLVRVYRFWEENHTAYMAMPYCEGPTLKSARDGMLRPPDEVWLRDRLLLPLLGALETLHAGSCLHRDVSPGNILLKSDGQPVLLDFGSARRVVADMTQPLTAILNPSFAAIEQYAESPNLPQGPWTDLYGLAGVVYYALSGRAPVPATVRAVNEAALMPMGELAKLVARNFPGLHYSAPFLAAIDKALAVRPTDRPQSAQAMREALASSHVQPDVMIEGAPLQAVPDPGPPEITLFDGDNADKTNTEESDLSEEEEKSIRAAIATAIGDVADWPPLARSNPPRIDPVMVPDMPSRDERAAAATLASLAPFEARKPPAPPSKVSLKVVSGQEAEPRSEPAENVAAADAPKEPRKESLKEPQKEPQKEPPSAAPGVSADTAPARPLPTSGPAVQAPATLASPAAARLPAQASAQPAATVRVPMPDVAAAASWQSTSPAFAAMRPTASVPSMGTPATGDATAPGAAAPANGHAMAAPAAATKPSAGAATATPPTAADTTAAAGLATSPDFDPFISARTPPVETPAAALPSTAAAAAPSTPLTASTPLKPASPATAPVSASAAPSTAVTPTTPTAPPSAVPAAEALPETAPASVRTAEVVRHPARMSPEAEARAGADTEPDFSLPRWQPAMPDEYEVPLPPPSRPAWHWAAAAGVAALLAAGAWQWAGQLPPEARLSMLGKTPAPVAAPAPEVRRPAVEPPVVQPSATTAAAVASVEPAASAAPQAEPVPPPPTTTTVAEAPAAAATVPAPTPEAAASAATPTVVAEAEDTADVVPGANERTSTSGTTGAGASASSRNTRKGNASGSRTTVAAAAMPRVSTSGTHAATGRSGSSSDPRAACGGRSNFSLYYCMRTQCRHARFASHPQCKRLHENDEVP